MLYLMLQNYNLYIWIIIEECQIFRNVSQVYTGTINFLFSSRLRQTLKHINSLAREIQKGALVRHTVAHLTPLYPALQLQLYPLMSSLHYNSSTIKTLHWRTDGPTDRQTDGPTPKQTDRQTDTDRQRDRQWSPWLICHIVLRHIHLK